MNGVATVSVTLSDSYTSLQLRAVDSVTATLTGLSNTFQVYFDSVSLTAYPKDATTIRISWYYPTGTNKTLLYRDSGSGFQLISTLFSPTALYVDTGRTPGQTYTYRAEVQNNTGTIVYSATTSAASAGCTTTISAGDQPADSWTAAGSPYCVTGNLNVTGNLTISPGVIILVSGTVSITIASGASLVSQGSASAPVIFTSANSSPQAGDWGGIIFASGSIGSSITSDVYLGGSVFRYTQVEYAGPGIRTVESLYLENTTVQNNLSTISGGGISASLANPRQLVLKNCLILNNTVSGAGAIYGGGLSVDQRAAIYSSVFFRNQLQGSDANRKGGAASLRGDNSLVMSSQFIENSLEQASNNIRGGALQISSFATVTGNTFHKNFITTSFGGHGAGLTIEGNNNTISNNVITNNNSRGSGTVLGTGIWAGGGSNTFTKNTVTGNYHNTAGSSAISMGSANTFTYNQVTQNVSGTTDRGAGFDGNGPSATATHNNIFGNIAPDAPNLFYSGIGTLDFTNNYWGGATSDKAAMGICDSINVCSGSTGIVDITGARATAWPLCKTAPSDPDCVGANF